MEPEPRTQSGFSRWLILRMQECGLPTNRDLAKASGVPESVISRWRNQAVTPSVEQLRRLRDPLQVQLLELLVQAGHLEPVEAGGRDLPEPRPLPLRVADAIAADPELPEDLRQLLAAQYHAMVAIGRAREQAKRIVPARRQP